MAQQPETLHFKNGDRLTGIGQGVADGALIWQLPYGKPFSVPLDLIDRVEYGSAKHAPKHQQGHPDAAADSESATDGQVKSAIYEEDESEAKQLNVILASGIAFDRACKDAFDRVGDWTKRLELGGQFLDGNSDDDYLGVNGRFEKQSANRHTEVDVGGQYGQSNGDRVTNRWFGNATVDFDKDGKWIRYVSSKNEYAEFENLDYRGTLSGGVGYRFYNTKRKRLIARIGPAVTQEFFRQPGLQRTTADLFAELESRWPLFDGARFENTMTFRPSIDDLHVFRLSSRAGLLFRLDNRDRWKLKLGMLLSHNSRPNVDRLSTDYTSNISLVYTRK